MNFQTNECPLCGKVLKFKATSGVTIYSCPAEEKPHYEVEKDGRESIQHMYAFPYAVDNYANSSRSRILRWKNNHWRFVKEISHLDPRPLDDLLSYLRLNVPIGTPCIGL